MRSHRATLSPAERAARTAAATKAADERRSKAARLLRVVEDARFIWLHLNVEVKS